MRPNLRPTIATLVIVASTLACGYEESASVQRRKIAGLAFGSDDAAVDKNSDYTALNIAFSSQEALALRDDMVTHVTLETRGGDFCWAGGDREWTKLSVRENLKLNRIARGCSLRLKQLWLTSGLSFRLAEGLDVGSKGAKAQFDAVEPQAAGVSDFAEVRVEQAPFSGTERTLALAIRLNAVANAPIEVAQRVNLQTNCGLADQTILEIDGSINPSPYGVEVTMQGEICPLSSNRLTVLFVVDYSSSMGRHIDQGIQSAGNDPQLKNGCGRLAGAKAVLERLKADKNANDTIMVGLIPFASAVVADRLIDPIPLERFLQLTDSDHFCRFIVQNSKEVGRSGYEGGITSKEVQGSTNYRAALEAAKTALGKVDGYKSVYFVTDGQPTSGGSDPKKAGVEAGKALRKEIANLNLNALLLGAQPGARQVLEEVAGSKDRVRVANNADQLATEILNFPKPMIDESSGRASHRIGAQETAIRLKTLVKDPRRSATWVWETEPFYLKGQSGLERLYQISVSAMDKDGTTYKQQVKVRYRMNP